MMISRGEQIFIVQAIISLISLVTGIILVFISTTNTEFTSGFTLIAGIVGYWLPNPSHKQYKYKYKKSINEPDNKLTISNESIENPTDSPSQTDLKNKDFVEIDINGEN